MTTIAISTTCGYESNYAIVVADLSSLNSDMLFTSVQSLEVSCFDGCVLSKPIHNVEFESSELRNSIKITYENTDRKLLNGVGARSDLFAVLCAILIAKTLGKTEFTLVMKYKLFLDIKLGLFRANYSNVHDADIDLLRLIARETEGSKTQCKVNYVGPTNVEQNEYENPIHKLLVEFANYRLTH